MGSGATKMRRSVSEADTAQDYPTGISVEEGMQWLKTMVDKEKAEKEWLAMQYENQCAEMKKLREECVVLRHDLNLTRQKASAGAAPSPIEAQMKQDVNLASPKSKEGEIISPKLQQRRNLKLSIDSGGDGSNRGPSTDVVKLPTLSKQPSLEVVQVQKSPSPAPAREAVQLSLPSIHSKTASAQENVQSAPGRTGSQSLSLAGGVVEEANDDEPMSALLRRRKEDWSVSASAEKPSDSDNTDEVKPLLVSVAKVQIMDEPSSPKRIKTNRMRSSAALKLDIVTKEGPADPSADPAAVKNGGN
jgi:hypothetical protein